MDLTLAEFPFTKAFLDDVIIGGEDMTDCYNKVYAILKKFEDLNIRVKLAKCQFFADQVECLGHYISAQGHIPLPKHEDAGAKCPIPQNISQT